MNLGEFLNMGGYALYVWSSYGLALVLLVWIFAKPVLDRKHLLKHLRSQYRQQNRQNQSP